MKSTNVIVLALLLTTLLTAMAIADDTPTDWNSASPAEIHHKLAQDKAAAMADKRFYRQIAAMEAMANDQTEYDVLFYDVDIRINDTTEIIYGIVRMVAESAIDSVGLIDVDFQAAMTVDSVTSPNGLRAQTHIGDVLTVTLDRYYYLGEQFEFTTHYHGHPTEGGFQGFSFDNRAGTPVISSLSEPYFARSWWPCKDRMDDKADSFNIAVTVDTLLYVASNGVLDSTVDHANNTHSFFYRVRYPMVSYLFSVAISDYTIWTDRWPHSGGTDSMLVIHAVYPDMYTYSLTKYDITPYALDVLSDNFGMYPFVDEKYGHANFEWGGAMEHQTMSSMAGSNFGFSEPVVVHEMAHQWWGDMITCESWSDIWLNEGWASWSEAMYFEVKDGFAAYKDYMNGMAYTGGGTIYVYDTTSVWNIFHGGLSYDKGAWVVHMLRGVLGDSLFFAGVDAYYNSEHQWDAATTEEFRDVFENATGEELDWFFQEWIYGTYRPYYEYSFYQEPSGTGDMDIYMLVLQTQTTYPELFHMPVPFVFEQVGGVKDTLRLWADERRKLFKLSFDNTLNNVTCDPDNWVLKYSVSRSWQLKFITDRLDTAMTYVEYADTLEARGGSGDNLYTVISGDLPDGLMLLADGRIVGATSDTGDFVFTVRVDDNFGSYYDELEFTLHVQPTDLIPGDVDLSFEEVNVADLVYLVSYMFQGGPAPMVMNLADVDGSCELDIADLVFLVTYMFQEGPAPVIGCME